MTHELDGGLPVFQSATLTLREVEASDAASLAHHLSAEEVVRFISRPPSTASGFERWIGRARTQRAEGTFVCFAMVPPGRVDAVGLIQLWRATAGDDEWGLGFLLGREFWGSGLFSEAAQAALQFAFATLKVKRIKAICSVDNDRGNRALAKLGAVHIGVAVQAPDPDGRVGDFREWEIRPDAFGRRGSVGLPPGQKAPHVR